MYFRQCPAYFARLMLIVCEMGGNWLYSCFFMGYFYLYLSNSTPSILVQLPLRLIFNSEITSVVSAYHDQENNDIYIYIYIYIYISEHYWSTNKNCQQLCADKGYGLDDHTSSMNDKDGIYIYIYIYIYLYVCVCLCVCLIMF